MDVIGKYQIYFEVLKFDLKIIDEYHKCYIDEFDTKTRCLLSIKIFENFKLFSKALINVAIDSLNIEESIIINENDIIIQTFQTIFCLDKITLNLNWKYKEAEYSFNSIKLNDNFYYVFGFKFIVILDFNGICLKKNVIEN